jgi:hypothetical protein
MAKISSDSTRGVSANIFCGIQDSFTTQGLQPKTTPNPPEVTIPGPRLRMKRRPAGA